MSNVEDKKNQLNLKIRELLKVIDIIDGIEKVYPDYKENTLNEEEFLNQQIELVSEAKNRLTDIFRD